MDRFLQNVASLEQEDVEDFQEISSSQKGPGTSNIWIDQFSSTLLPSTNAFRINHEQGFPEHGVLSTAVYPTIANQSRFSPSSSHMQRNQPQQPVPREATSNARQYTHYEHASMTYVPVDSNSWSPPFEPGQTVDHSTSHVGLNPYQPIQTLLASEASKPFNYGSDPQFAKNRFIAPANQRTEESITMEVLRQFQCLDPQGSVDSTRASSPFAERRTGLALKSTDPMDSITRTLETENVIKPLPKRKRLSTTQEKEDFLFEESPLSPQKSRIDFPVKKRGRPKTLKSESQTAAQGQHPRKKRAREKLSDEEKRSNHVNSEQKRRDEQNRQWNDLLDFVPGIKEGYRSKCDKIVYANRWLQQLLEANERMESYLRARDFNSPSSGTDQD